MSRNVNYIQIFSRKYEFWNLQNCNFNSTPIWCPIDLTRLLFSIGKRRLTSLFYIKNAHFWNCSEICIGWVVVRRTVTKKSHCIFLINHTTKLVFDFQYKFINLNFPVFKKLDVKVQSENNLGSNFSDSRCKRSCCSLRFWTFESIEVDCLYYFSKKCV